MTDVSNPVKKPFPEDRAIKLAMAREKALEVRRRNSLARKREQLKALEERVNPPPTENTETVPPVEPVVEEETVETPEVETPVKPPEQKAPKKKKKQMVVVEQSSEDSDEFEANPNVVFVKRVRAKAKAAKPVTEVMERQPPVSEPPPPTPLQQAVRLNYDRMFSGDFLRRF